MSESAEQAFFEIPVDWIRWKRAGQVQLDHSGYLAFPRVDAVPGIYRFTIEDGTTDVAQYVGQAARSLRTRFSLYRSRGKRPALPLERKTTSRNARYLLDALAAARTVWVDLVDDQATGPDGQVLVINFADKTLRSKLEKRLIVQACQTDSRVLNRGGNPRWDDARSV
jgi:hypothetical protein